MKRFVALVAIATIMCAGTAGADDQLDAFLRDMNQNPPEFVFSSPAPSPAATTPAPRPATRPVTRKWGAVAAALWRRRGVVQVAIGSAVRYQTEAEARAAAIRSCRGKRRINCKVRTTWNRGCGYIVTGRNSGGAGWVVGTSQADAQRKCRAKGYRCKRPIGGCVN